MKRHVEVCPTDEIVKVLRKARTMIRKWDTHVDAEDWILCASMKNTEELFLDCSHRYDSARVARRGLPNSPMATINLAIKTRNRERGRID